MHARWIWLAIVLLAAVGCGDEFATTDLDAGTNQNGYTLVVMASPDNMNILAGGAVTIMVEVTAPGGDGVDSAPVLLTTTMGILGETELTADVDGFAATTLSAGETTGYAVVVATYKGIQAMVEVDFWSGAAGG